MLKLKLHFKAWKPTYDGLHIEMCMWFVADHNVHQQTVQLPKDASTEEKQHTTRMVKENLLRQFINLHHIELVDAESSGS